MGVSKALGDKELMEDVNFIIPAGAIVGIIGPNGAGKTTLFKMLVGQEKPDAGTLTSVTPFSSRMWISSVSP